MDSFGYRQKRNDAAMELSERLKMCESRSTAWAHGHNYLSRDVTILDPAYSMDSSLNTHADWIGYT